MLSYDGAKFIQQEMGQVILISRVLQSINIHIVASLSIQNTQEIITNIASDLDKTSAS